MFKISRFGVGLALLASSGCTQASQRIVASPDKAPIQAPLEKPLDDGKSPSTLFDPGALDRSVNACDDFYRFACGGWQKSFQLPADKGSYVRQSSTLDADAETLMHDGLEMLKAELDHGNLKPNDARLASFYAACMDTAGTSATQAALIRAELDRIALASSGDAFAEEIAHLHRMGVNALFSFGSWANAFDSAQRGAGLSSAGYALPNRDFYLGMDGDMVATQKNYRAHIAKILVLSGETAEAAAKAADDIFAFEKRLVEKTLPIDQIESHPEWQVHVSSIEELTKLAPGFAWKAYFKALGVPEFTVLNISEPGVVSALQLALTEAAPTLSVYLRWQLLHASASFTTGDAQKEDFRFWKHEMNGQPEEAPRWKVCVQAAQNSLPEALGQLFVAHYAESESIRARAEKMMVTIEAEFGKDLGTLDWLDTETRDRAAQKLAKVARNVGYPAKWKNYEGMKLVPASYLETAQAVATFNTQEDLARIGKPNDRSLWEMGIWEANAYYSRENNSMNFPLGSLIPPVFDVKASDGLNFGSFGASWIGHELTHGFDSGGRRYDGDGNLKDWWTAPASAAFDKKMECYIGQADAYEVLPGLHVNGKNTITENLADQGGFKIGWTGYRELAKSRPPAKPIAGFTEDQQFFLAYAQAWCAKRTDQSLKHLVLTNSHPPEEFRTNGVIMNAPGFAAAFGCPVGARMVPAKQCSAW